MDFGAGRETQHGAPMPLTGTPLYMAPEVLAGGPMSVRSDVCALGVLLQHLLTAPYPVIATSVQELASARASQRAIAAARPASPVDARPAARAWPALVVAGVLAALGWLALERRVVSEANGTALLPAPTLRQVMLPDVMLIGRPRLTVAGSRCPIC